MTSNKGSTTVFITVLCMVVLALGAVAGWQWHQNQMQNLALENLSLQQQLEELAKCPTVSPVLEDQTTASIGAEAELERQSTGPATTRELIE